MASVDATSEHIVRILYAAFLIFAVILLLNMLIALLCNTFQRTEVRGDKSTPPFTVIRVIAVVNVYVTLTNVQYISDSLRCTSTYSFLLWSSLTSVLFRFNRAVYAHRNLKQQQLY